MEQTHGNPALMQLGVVLGRARDAAIDYYRMTGKPLGITGELGEFEAARLLELSLSDAREPGFDAVDRFGRRLQIKTRALTDDAMRRSQQVGSIKLNYSWDAVLLVLLDGMFAPVQIWEADRTAIELALSAPGSRARNERGALAVSKFKQIGRRVWPSL